ncbi:MAG: hypothetical protein GQ574_27945 [Crocinitomix sp.]|nr:hypothetical protein [Crocinitomix sp.]
MPYFKKQEYALDLSQNEVKAYLDKITKQKGQKKQLKRRFTLFKGRVQRDRFHISINRYFQPLAVTGTIESTSDEKSRLQLMGKFVWRNRIMNAILFTAVASILLLLCALLLKENMVQGVFACLFSLLLTFVLYRSLIGGMRKYYREICADLVHLLSVNVIVKPMK